MVLWECFALAKVLESKNEIKLRLKLQEIKFYFIVLKLCCQMIYLQHSIAMIITIAT